MSKKRVAVLGATGSIGASTLDVIRACPDFFEPVLFTARRNTEKLFPLTAEFTNAAIALSDDAANYSLPTTHYSLPTTHYPLYKDVLQALEETAPDIVVNGISGSAGLLPSLKAAESGATLALANKESVVMAWDLLSETAARSGGRIVPVDSECSAIFHLVERHGLRNTESIILTASGGPFRTASMEELAAVTIEKALAHPTWKMGPKITLDSASLANKGLEVIQISKIIGLAASKIDVSVHPQSIVHSMIAVKDGAIYAALSAPDMRVPIHQALHYPAVVPSPWGKMNFDMRGAPALTLSFEKPDMDKFPMLALAYQAAKAGGFYPLAYNAANEIAGALFLRGGASFLDIPKIAARVLEKDWSAPQGMDKNIDAIMNADAGARSAAQIAAQVSSAH
ncbi:MAG: 1-deoxy-D-xylulose-5-phosphate reductoisomerase [Spirochaetaceae bacterium]|jgi:1-deoxy-D-xylulose-5-phosphate reductoisomerase|nr:1-deoxy-D-xylulose-5-phosphate reductoisomerase [Spirochaetaceae bacterium]